MKQEPPSTSSSSIYDDDESSSFHNESFEDDPTLASFDFNDPSLNFML